MSIIPNLKYKTTLCENWIQGKTMIMKLETAIREIIVILRMVSTNFVQFQM